LDVPVVSKARANTTKAVVRVPTFEGLESYLSRRYWNHVEPKEELFPWEQRESRAFWRGGLRIFTECAQTGCVSHGSTMENFGRSNRVRLVRLSNRYPDLLDAKFSYAHPEALLKKFRRYGFMGDYLIEGEQLRYKYLVDVDGATISDTRPLWILLSGSVLLKQVTALVPAHLTAMEPYRHYIPVRDDLADLAEKITWAREHDGEAREIAARGREFAHASFLQPQMIAYLARVLAELAQVPVTP
jgi:hypothetical protein